MRSLFHQPRRYLYKQAHLILIFSLIGLQARFVWAQNLTVEQAQLLLEVGPNATKEQIHAAWKMKAREYHPDLNVDAAAEQLMKLVNHAHDLLIANFDKTANTSTQSTATTWDVRAPDRQHLNIPPNEDGFQFVHGYGDPDFPGTETYYGLHTTSVLKDFSLDEMRSRTGQYGRFNVSLAPEIATELIADSNPYRFYLLNIFEYQLKTLPKQHPYFFFLAGGSFLPMFFSPNSDPFYNILPAFGVSALGLAQALSSLQVRTLIQQTTKKLNGLILEMNYDNQVLEKQQLFAYDIVERIIYLTIPLDEIKTNRKKYYKQLVKLLKLFPGSETGFTLRARSGVGLAGQFKDLFESDFAKNPSRWGATDTDVVRNGSPNKCEFIFLSQNKKIK